MDGWPVVVLPEEEECTIIPSISSYCFSIYIHEYLVRAMHMRFILQ
jgi:hypothetical protein